uniref:Odorant receptor n=1 Tax=Plutella xylostella TaxID=51655 RepID=A0A8G1GM45_PLUXY|nr:odorant receptor 44 [Plutella xylostella]
MKNTSCLKISIAAMVVTGVWSPRMFDGKPHLQKLYLIYASFFQVFLFGGIILIEFLHLIQVIDDLEETAEVSLLLLTHLAQVAKVMTIWGRQARIKHLLYLLDDPSFDRSEPAKKAILESTCMFAWFVSKFLVASTLFTALMWGVFPMLKPTLTVPLNYPYMTSDSPFFIMMFIYQLTCIVLNALGDTAEDFLVGGLIVLASAQLDVLSFELSHIGQHNDIDINYTEAVNCVKYHMKIISFVNELEAIFGLPVFIQFVASCIVIGLTAFKIVMTNEPIQLLTLVFYLVCILSELLVYCYFGNIIMHKSEVVAAAAYDSGWERTSLPTQRMLLLLMRRAQRPLAMSAGNMFHLSLLTFTAILKSSYSYFAVVRE